MSRTYAKPKTADELADCLKRQDGGVYILAGGTDLAVRLYESKSYGCGLIDVSHVKEMKTITETGDEIIIGAAVTFAELASSDIIQKELPALSQAAGQIGSTQIRNMATIGGNASNGSPSADSLTVLFAYGASCDVMDETRKITAESVEKLAVSTKRAIIRFRIPKSNVLSGFSKLGDRKSVTISKINCCVTLKLSDGVIHEPRCYLGAVGKKPIKADIIENALLNTIFTPYINISIQSAISAQIEAAIPSRASKAYKERAAIGVVENALAQIAKAVNANV